MRHLKTLLFAQFSGLSSLRELCDGMAAQPASLYHLGLRLPRRSTLCDALSQRPAGVFRDICGGLLGQAQRTVRREGAALIQLLDASPIMILDQRSAWAERDKHTRGLKLHIGSDPRETLLDWVVTSPRISDIKAARAVPITSGTTYVYDKPVLSACKAVEGAPRGGARNTLYDTDLREIRVMRDGKAPLVLITNDHSRPASEIAALYKWIKQNLKIKRWSAHPERLPWQAVEGGRSENAVKTQIYVALIAFLLLRLFRAATLPTGNPKSAPHTPQNRALRPVQPHKSHQTTPAKEFRGHYKGIPERNSGDTIPLLSQKKGDSRYLKIC